MTATQRRLTTVEASNLHAFGEIAVDLATNKARYAPREACGFYGQNLTGGEFIPEDLVHLRVLVDEREVAGVRLDPSWTVDQIWTVCQATARHVVYARLKDAPKRDEAYSRLKGLGCTVTADPVLVDPGLGSPLAWDMTFFEIEGEEITAHLVPT